MNETLQVDALNDLKNSGSVKLISNDQYIHGDTKKNITNFINNNAILKGEEWNAVRTKLQ